MLHITAFLPGTRSVFDANSISINQSFRITIEFLIEDETIVPVNVGPHDYVY